MTLEVPFFNYPALFQEKEAEMMALIQDVLQRGAYILQKELEEFEKNLESFLDVKHVIGVADGTNALKLSLWAAGIRPGDHVIVPGHTYVASVASIHYVGAHPVFVECGSDHLIDESVIEAAVTPKTAAIMPVQLNGRTSNMEAICHVAAKHGLKIIEDSAQALGSKFKGQSAGSFGDAGTFSFYPAKLLGCFGDGGAVITNNDCIASKVRLLRDHGRNQDGEVVDWGTNSRLDNLQAAVLDFKLKTFPKDIERRREIAQMYQEGLGSLEQLLLPPAPGLGDHFDVYQNYEIEALDRNKLQQTLREKGIGTIVQFGGKPVHKYPLGFENTKLSHTEELSKRMLMLPMNTALTDADVSYVIEQTCEFYKS